VIKTRLIDRRNEESREGGFTEACINKMADDIIGQNVYYLNFEKPIGRVLSSIIENGHLYVDIKMFDKKDVECRWLFGPYGFPTKWQDMTILEYELNGICGHNLDGGSK